MQDFHDPRSDSMMLCQRLLFHCSFICGCPFTKAQRQQCEKSIQTSQPAIQFPGYEVWLANVLSSPELLAVMLAQ